MRGERRTKLPALHGLGGRLARLIAHALAAHLVLQADGNRIACFNEELEIPSSPDPLAGMPSLDAVCVILAAACLLFGVACAAHLGLAGRTQTATFRDSDASSFELWLIGLDGKARSFYASSGDTARVLSRKACVALNLPTCQWKRLSLTLHGAKLRMGSGAEVHLQHGATLRAFMPLLGGVGLEVPDQVTVAGGEGLRRFMRNLVRGEVGSYYPGVLVSYATGSRPGEDGPGCGPGMFYCRHIAEMLNERGVGCFTGLHVIAGTDWKVFLEKLNSRSSDCQVLVVVVTPALFHSKPCLEEIYNALDAKLTIVPIIFEGPIPRLEDQWPKVGNKDDTDKNKLMLKKVTQEFSNLNTIPAPPGTVLQQPEALAHAIDGIVSGLDRRHVGAVVPPAPTPAMTGVNSFRDDGHTSGYDASASVHVPDGNVPDWDGRNDASGYLSETTGLSSAKPTVTVAPKIIAAAVGVIVLLVLVAVFAMGGGGDAPAGDPQPAGNPLCITQDTAGGDPCSQSAELTGSGTICYMPQGGYPMSADCTWHISCSGTVAPAFTLTQLDTERQFDTVSLSSGENTVAELSGGGLGDFEGPSGAQELTVHFVSDDAAGETGGGGFAGTYNCFDRCLHPTRIDCGEHGHCVGGAGPEAGKCSCADRYRGSRCEQDPLPCCSE